MIITSYKSLNCPVDVSIKSLNFWNVEKSQKSVIARGNLHSKSTVSSFHFNWVGIIIWLLAEKFKDLNLQPNFFSNEQ